MNWFLRKSLNVVIYFLALIFIKAISYYFMFSDVYSGYVLLEPLFCLLFVTPIFFIKSRKLECVYLTLFVTLYLILYVVNTNFFSVYGDIFSMTYFNLIGGGLAVVDSSYINICHLGICLFLYVEYLVLLYLNNKKSNFHFDIPAKFIKKCLIGGLSFMLLICGVISVNFVTIENNENQYDQSLDYILISKNYYFEKLGMFPYYFQEIKSFFDTDKYEQKVDISKANEYTSLLEDFNVFTIMIETGIQEIVNPVLTPNLYKLLNDGVNLENTYSKNKTNMSECIGITGYYPTSGITSLKETLDFSLPSILNDKYDTMYFHDVSSSVDIYRRRNLIPLLGFENVYLHEEILPNTEGWHWGGNYPLDSVVVDKICDTILNKASDDPFYAYWTTLQMHGPYHGRYNSYLLQGKYASKLNSAKAVGDYVNPIEGDESASCFDTFMLAAMDFDCALGILFDRFESAGILDKTLFVVYGDHDLYYNGKDGNSISSKMYDLDTLYDPKMYKVVMGFYNETLNKMVSDIDQFASPYVIVPTILDLLGYQYNYNDYMATSIFDEEFTKTQVFYSLELTSFFNNKLWSKGATIDYVYDNKADQDEFIQIVRSQLNKITVLNDKYNEYR